LRGLGRYKSWVPGRNDAIGSTGREQTDSLVMEPVGLGNNEILLTVGSPVKDRLMEYGLLEKFKSATILLSRLLQNLGDRGVEVDKWIGCDMYGEMEALRWGNGYKFSLNVTDRNRIDLENLDYVLIALVKRRQKDFSAKRMSLESIQRISQDNPDFGHLKELVEGLRIFVAADFVPNGQPPPLRKKYLRVGPSVDKVMMELITRDWFFLPTLAAMKVSSIHFACTHWTTKAGKAKGIPLGDCLKFGVWVSA